MLREAVGAALEGAYAGLALLGFAAALGAGAPVAVLLPFWVLGVMVVATGPVSRSAARWLRARRGAAR